MPDSALWKEEYSLHIKEIDTQHMRFFQLINDVYSLLLKEPTERDLVLAIGFLGDYSLYHFDTEERYFDDFHYEGADAHKQWHGTFREKATDYMSKCRDPRVDRKALAQEVADFARDWLVHHILIEDKKYVQCLKDNGIA